MTPTPRHLDHLDFEVDLREERDLDRRLRAHRGRSAPWLLLVAVVVACLLGGALVGYLMGTRGEPGGQAPVVGAATGSTAERIGEGRRLTEAERMVRRRLAEVAFERASGVIATGVVSARGHRRPGPAVQSPASELPSASSDEGRGRSRSRRRSHEPEWLRNAGSEESILAPLLNLEQYDPYPHPQQR